jgi:hypothetical protein
LERVYRDIREQVKRGMEMILSIDCCLRRREKVEYLRHPGIRKQ